MKAARSSGEPTRHQLRTEATLRELLEAAQTVFVRDGYQQAQIEAIAAQAGRTKGAVYAHFQSKEDIFFALLEREFKRRQEAFLQSIRDVPLSQQIEVLKERFLNGVEDESWQILMLEFKLFALRNKGSLRRMRDLYRLLYDSLAQGFLSQAERLADGQKDRMIIRLAVLRGIPAAVILEKQFYPVLNSPEAKSVLEEVFDSLLYLRALKPGRKGK